MSMDSYDEWVPVSERPPKEKGEYLVSAVYPERSTGKPIKTAFWNGVVWIVATWFDWPQNNRLNPQPTHWMRSPKPPTIKT